MSIEAIKTGPAAIIHLPSTPRLQFIRRAVLLSCVCALRKTKAIVIEHIQPPTRMKENKYK